MENSEHILHKIIYDSLIYPAVVYGGVSMNTPVYAQTYTTSQYIYYSNLPQMSKFTICLWFWGQEDDDGRSDDYIFSLATSCKSNLSIV